MSFFDWPVVFLIASWIVCLTMIPIVVTRKTEPQTCLAWLLIVFFQPWIGLILFVLLGEDRLSRKRLRLRRVTGRKFETADSRITANSKGRAQLAGSQAMLASIGEAAGRHAAVTGNSVEFTEDTDEFVGRLIEDIDAATDHVHLLFYIFREDATGRRVGEALRRARERNVECRVLADSVGSWNFFGSLGRELKEAGVEVQDCLPVGLLRRRLARVDMRNHRKLAVIDGQVAWTGSQNLVDDDYGHRTAGAWHDVMVRVRGPVVHQIQITFLEDWFLDTEQLLSGDRYFPVPADSGHSCVQIVPSGPDQPTTKFQGLVVEAIHSAQERVVITSPYLIPDEALLCALRLAALRGVRVEVILPDRSDHWLVDAASSFYVGELLREGVGFHRFQKGLLHAKTLTVDDNFALVGSANFDVRSFHLNFEISLLLYDQEAIRDLIQIQENYRNSSAEIQAEAWEKRPEWRKLLGNIAKLFSSIL